jgi:hypothetical protein
VRLGDAARIRRRVALGRQVGVTRPRSQGKVRLETPPGILPRGRWGDKVERDAATCSRKVRLETPPRYSRRQPAAVVGDRVGA